MENPYMVNSKSRAHTKTLVPLTEDPPPDPLTEGERVCTAYSDQRIIPGKLVVPRERACRGWNWSNQVITFDMVCQQALQRD
jgi:hypothetical protein